MDIAEQKSEHGFGWKHGSFSDPHCRGLHLGDIALRALEHKGALRKHGVTQRVRL
jgi:hypothetical protein